MKKTIYPILTIVLLFTSAFAFVREQNWNINPEYTVKFSGKYADGIFKTLTGTIVFDEQKLASSRLDVTIEVASINTGNGLKNKHAKSAKWFDVEKYPVIHFVSSSVSKTDNGYQAKGELQMHGIKKTITIPFTFSKNGGLGTFYGKFKVNRGDFGIGEAKGNESDFTTLEVTVPVTSKQ
jgi:polyisoprenoid-binding protein YceI